jgi:hypothetical protein
MKRCIYGVDLNSEVLKKVAARIVHDAAMWLSRGLIDPSRSYLHNALHAEGRGNAS